MRSCMFYSSILPKSQKIQVTVPPGPSPSNEPSIYQPGSDVPPVGTYRSVYTIYLTNRPQQYLANPPIDPGAADYYKEGQSQQDNTGPWGPPSAYPANESSQAPGAVPLYNARDERVPPYSGMASAVDYREKGQFEEVKV